MNAYEILAGAISIFITLLFYAFARSLANVRFLKAIPSVIIGACAIILVVELSPLSYENYAIGGDIFVWLLAPATVALAYPLYQFSRLIRENFLEIFCATIASALISIASMIMLGWIFGLDSKIVNSLLSKCVTTPVALEISKMSGGIAGFTVCGVFISGIFGSMIAYWLFKICKIKSDVSMGLAMGSTSHVIGTAKCMQVSERQSALSALVLVLVAIFTTLLFSLAKFF